MTWRTIAIAKPAKLSLDINRLKIAQQEIHYFPLEDIATVVLESPQITITSSLLSALAAHNITLLTCNASHHPNGVLHAFHRHSRQTKIARLQISITQAFKKRLQQIIIKNKIANQSHVAYTINSAIAKKLRAMAVAVKSGDSGYLESQAAKPYFKLLFGKDFTRNQAGAHNAALNYGYAIVRAATARALVAKGFLPCFGLFHRSELNAFNLADDVMEPFRPFVDKYTLEAVNIPEWRHHMLGVLSQDVAIDGERLWILNAIERVADSLHSALVENNYKHYKIVNFA